MTVQNLLVEIFVEELPPKSLKKLGQSFAQGIVDGLKKRELLDSSSVATAYASPRRLAVHMTKVKGQAADKAVSQRLMPVKVGLDAEAKATPALLKKLSALGMDESVVPALKRVDDGKNEMLFYDFMQTGIELAAGLQQSLDKALTQLPIAKVMTYQLADGWESVNFVRPAHAMVALHGEQVLDIHAFGLRSSNITYGHRFEATQSKIVLAHADNYAQQLREQGAVIASFSERRHEIQRQIQQQADKAGLKAIEDDDLLDEVTALVERPNVLLGTFESEFLQVPSECLILTMKANQKYFPLLNADGSLSNQFLIVSNISPADSSLVVQGNERVVRPRLADAQFFFEQDKKKTLAERVAGLGKVVYHNKLGSQGERIARVKSIAQAIAAKLAQDGLEQKAAQAAALAKADLLTDMVGEFPELQGIMGRYYALHDGLSEEVALAIEDHYKPRFAGDALPGNNVGLCVALADKLETLAGLFGIGQIPSGDKDPFALRRHALGVIRMLIEAKLPLALSDLIQSAFAGFDATKITLRQQELEDFMFDRLGGLMREQGYRAQEVDAVLSLRPMQLSLVLGRLQAVRAFAELPEADALAAANKRVGNILKKSEGIAAEVKCELLVEAAEQALHQSLQQVVPEVEQAFAKADFSRALQQLAALRQPVDTFFDGVMVNATDPALRNNRLALLQQLHQAMNQVADISRLAV